MMFRVAWKTDGLSNLTLSKDVVKFGGRRAYHIRIVVNGRAHYFDK
jgi:hypothetical protein